MSVLGRKEIIRVDRVLPDGLQKKNHIFHFTFVVVFYFCSVLIKAEPFRFRCANSIFRTDHIKAKMALLKGNLVPMPSKTNLVLSNFYEIQHVCFRRGTSYPQAEVRMTSLSTWVSSGNTPYLPMALFKQLATLLIHDDQLFFHSSSRFETY